MHGSIGEARRHAHGQVARRAQVDHDARSRGLGEDVGQDRAPGGLEAVHVDEPRADVQAIRRDPVARPERAPQRGGDDHAAIGLGARRARTASARRGRRGAARCRPRAPGAPAARGSQVLRATSAALEGRVCSRRNASGRALVATSASRIRFRVSVRSGKDSSPSTTGRPSSSGGAFVSDGGRTISMGRPTRRSGRRAGAPRFLRRP